MKQAFQRFAGLAVLAACGVCCAAGASGDSAAKQGRPAFDAGGYVTLDYEKRSPDATLDIGETGLDARVNISDEATALIELKVRKNPGAPWIDQALVSYKPKELSMELLFGQQTFNYGLLARRLISSPYLYEMADLRKPGLVVNGSMGDAGGGLGFTILSHDPGEGRPQVHLYTALANIDVQLPAKSLARLSTLINKDTIRLDLAGGQNFWHIVLDYEALATIKTPSDSLKSSGFCGGLFWKITDHFGLGLRGDGMYHDNFKTLDSSRIGAGAVIDFKDGLYCALEIGHCMPANGTARDEILVEFGLERKLPLPGFQRKTLFQR